MPRSPLTETIKRAEGMVHYVQENLSEEEYMLFLDMVDPLPEPVQKPTKKKSSKKSAGGGGRKSTRSESLKQQISGRGQSLVQPSATATTDDTDDSTHTRCQFIRADGKLCFLLPDHNIHHLPTAMEYHGFVVGKSDAQSAVAGS